MNGAIRRRGFKPGNKFVINAVDNPNIMAELYEKGLCASPDGITKKECEAVKSLSIRTAMNEDFDGFQYFTGITFIPINSFYSAALTHIVFPPTITYLGSDCFRYNSFKGVIKIPKSVKTIDARALLYSSSGSATIIMEGSIPPTVSNGNFMQAIAIYVPDESLQNYITAWSGTVSSSKIKPISEYQGN